MSKQEEEEGAGMGAELEFGEASNAAAIVGAVERLAGVEVIGVPGEGAPAPLVIVAPKGKDLYSAKQFLDELREVPERRRGTATLLDLASFINHACRFKDERRSAIFAVRDPKAPQLIAVLDYHARGHASEPNWAQHRGVYAFPLSEEWRRWTGSNKRTMSQTEFAEFIEANILEVLPPDAAGAGAQDFAARLGVEFAAPQRLMEVSRNLSVRVTDRVTQAVTLQSGEAQFSFASTHADETGAPLKVPAAFLIGLPIFTGGECFQIAARLRYRAKEGVVSWWYELHRADRAFEVAVEDAAKAAAEATGLPLFFGTPEA
jgi:uncharacterized protein YfdQ (DUF2303 family)